MQLVSSLLASRRYRFSEHYIFKQILMGQIRHEVDGSQVLVDPEDVKRLPRSITGRRPKNLVGVG